MKINLEITPEGLEKLLGFLHGKENVIQADAFFPCARTFFCLEEAESVLAGDSSSIHGYKISIASRCLPYPPNTFEELVKLVKSYSLEVETPKAY